MKTKNKTAPRRFALAFLLAALAVSSLAMADEEGNKGTMTSLQINHSTSETYLAYHGRMTVSEGKGVSAEYRWGGASCGSRTLPDNLVAMLQRALETGAPIEPRYQLGQGGSKCLVGFTVMP